MSKEKVIIIGGGFGGVKAALELEKDDRFEVCLISKSADLLYYPTLYRVATGGNSDSSAIPLRTIFQNKKVKLIQAEAASIDTHQKTITTVDKTSYSYDKAIFSLGVITNYFNIPGLEEFSYGVKSLEDIDRLKRHIHQKLVDDNKPELNYVIVGAGPTGIEIAGALPDYIHKLMKLHKIEHRAVHVDLIEAAPRLLPRLPKDTAKTIKKRLQKKGVRLYLNQIVQGQTANSLTVSGKEIQSHTVIWTAGMANNPFFAANNFVLSANHKVAVDIYLQADRDVFVIGDNANTPYSGMAQTAIDDAIFIAKNLILSLDGKKMKSYNPKEPITVIPVGENWAALVKGQLRIYGYLGWLLRQAADAIAFHDYETWFRASNQVLKYYDNDQICQACLENIGPTSTTL